MKVLSKVLLITLLAAIFGLAGCNQNKLPKVKSSAIPLPTIKPSTTDKSVTVIFPQKANLRLVGGVSKTGWVKINLEAKQIEISLNRDSAKVDFAQVKKVNFDLNRAILNDGDIVIRSEEPSEFVRDTFTQVPVSDLKLEEGETGIFRVKLNNSVLKNEEQTGIISAIRDGIYVVEEMLFDESSQKMTLKVLCCTAG